MVGAGRALRSGLSFVAAFFYSLFAKTLNIFTKGAGFNFFIVFHNYCLINIIIRISFRSFVIRAAETAINRRLGRIHEEVARLQLLRC